MVDVWGEWNVSGGRCVVRLSAREQDGGHYSAKRSLARRPHPGHWPRSEQQRLDLHQRHLADAP
jgi:hypothetical protein